MLRLQSRCSIPELLGSWKHKNQAAEQCEEPAGSCAAPLLHSLQCSLSLGEAAASEPHLTSSIAEFPGL